VDAGKRRRHVVRHVLRGVVRASCEAGLRRNTHLQVPLPGNLRRVVTGCAMRVSGSPRARRSKSDSRSVRCVAYSLVLLRSIGHGLLVIVGSAVW
jgi:hypothetical protein